jgi:hypothetical protein
MIGIGMLLAAALFPFTEAQNLTSEAALSFLFPDFCVSESMLQFIGIADEVGVVYGPFSRPFER